MPETTIDSSEFALVLAMTAAGLKEHIDELRDLDAALGDGDLGVTAELGANAMAAFLDMNSESDIGKMLVQLGMHINRANPSTFGTLLASAFMGAGKSAQTKSELTAADLLVMGDAAVDAIKRLGKAGAGDKTMLDALIPAVEAFRKALAAGHDLSQALDAASQASEGGSNSTAAMKAKFGRVSWRPDGGVGMKDGGAAAMDFLIRSFSLSLNEVLFGRPG